MLFQFLADVVHAPHAHDGFWGPRGRLRVPGVASGSPPPGSHRVTRRKAHELRIMKHIAARSLVHAELIRSMQGQTEGMQMQIQPPQQQQGQGRLVGGSTAPATQPYSLEIKTVQAVAFKVLVEALKELLTDTSIEFDETGMKIMAMDTSHVVLVHLKLEASKFEVFHCEGRMSIGINMLNLHKLIKTINNNNTLSLYIDRDDVNHLGIKIENSEKNTRTTYKLDLLDMDHQGINVDPTEFSEVVTLPSCDFQKICRDMHNLAEYMEIRSVQNQVVFSCKGDFCSQETVLCDSSGNRASSASAATASATSATASGAAEDPPGPAVAPVTTVATSGSTDIIQGVFSIKHLVLFTKCTNLCSTMELYLKNDYPLIIQYDVSSLGSIRLALAPQGG